MENAFLNDTSALQAMTQVQEALLEAESFLNENYQFRHNLLSGKTEFKRLPDATAWEVLTEMAVNSIILHAKREGIGGKRSPKNNIEELLHSNQVPLFDPIREYLDALPEWDGKNHVAQLFGRLPGVTSEQLSWLSTWLSSNEVLSGAKLQFPQLRCDQGIKVRLGKTLRYIGCESKHSKKGMLYRLIPIAA
ncbi:MAG: hypothetical protein ACI4C3_02995 [Bacteroides sp.]